MGFSTTSFFTIGGMAICGRCPANASGLFVRLIVGRMGIELGTRDVRGSDVPIGFVKSLTLIGLGWNEAG